MTLRELYYLHDLEKLIERDVEAIARMEASLSAKAPALTGMPHAPGVSDRIGDTVPEIIDRKKKLEKRIRERKKARDAITTFIDSIDDPHVMLIFSLRFIDRLTWNDVADKVGGGNTEDSVKKICYRYLKTSQKSYTSRKTVV